MVAFLDIVGPELNRVYDSKSNAAPQLNHLLRQALLSCSGGVRLDEEANGPMQLLRIDVSKQAGKAERWCLRNADLRARWGLMACIIHVLSGMVSFCSPSLLTKGCCGLHSKD